MCIFEYKGFIGSVEFSEEDGVYFSKIEGIEGLVTYEGETIKKLEVAFRESVDYYIDFCRNNIFPNLKKILRFGKMNKIYLLPLQS